MSGKSAFEQNGDDGSNFDKVLNTLRKKNTLCRDVISHLDSAEYISPSKEGRGDNYVLLNDFDVKFDEWPKPKVDRDTDPEFLSGKFKSLLEKNFKEAGEDLEKTVKVKPKPRWAEEYRGTDQVPMRFSVAMLERIDVDAEARDLTRNDWFIQVFRSHLATKVHARPDDWPDYREKRDFKIRIDPELNAQIKNICKSLNLSKTEWARRLSWAELEKQPNPRVAPSPAA